LSFYKLIYQNTFGSRNKSASFEAEYPANTLKK